MPRPRLWWCSLLLALTACATATAAPRAPRPVAAASPPAPASQPPPPRPQGPPAAPSLRERVVSRASSALGEPDLSGVSREVSDDCTGFVRWAYRASGDDLVEG